MPYYPAIPPVTSSGGVTIPYLTGVSVYPATASVNSGSTQQYTASGTMSGTLGLASGVLPNSFLSWSSSNTALATVNQSGLATIMSGTSGGSVVYISASVLGSVFGTAVLTATQAFPTIFNPTSSSIMDHIYFNSTSIQVSSGSAWTKNGTPTLGNSTGSIYYAEGFSDSNYFRANDTAAFQRGKTSNFTWAIIVRYNTITNGTVMSTFNGSSGVAMQAYSGYSIFAGSGANSMIPVGTPTNGKYYIFMGGEDNGTFKGQLNQQTITTMTPTFNVGSFAAWLGRGNDAGYALTSGAIVEAIFLDRAATSASFADLYTQAAAKLTLG